MWSLLERAKKIIFALVLSIIPLVLLYVQSKDKEIRDVLAWPVTEFSGFIEKGALSVTGFLSDKLFRYFYLVGRSDELLRLRAEVLETKSLKARIETLVNEKAAIDELKLVTNENGLKIGEVARVIARAGAPMARMVRLDRGSKDGIKEASPVIAHNGVVGQVLSVAPHFCDVLLITDASSAIDAKIVGSNARGLLRGITTSQNYLMEIRDIDGLIDVSPGHIVVTSGINSNFPEGIPIGTIIESHKSRDGLYVSARIKPFVTMDQLSFVFVVNMRENNSKRYDATLAEWPLATK